MSMFRFEYMFFLYPLLPLVFAFIFWRFFYYRPVRYSYSLGSYFGLISSRYSFRRFVVPVLRSIILIMLVFLISKPQFVDEETKMPVDGIDIMLVLDMSGSMDLADFGKRTRFSVAKEEAIRFINKRDSDAIGLILFAKYAISRCPLTFDKKLLESVILPLQIGFIDSEGTMLAKSIVAGVNRLKNSKAKSKIIILLTDGEPTEGDLDISVALEAANYFSIKIYTIGIGSDVESNFFHPLYGPIKVPGVNKELLINIADQTGGKMFMAHNATDMRLIYDTINSLEKASYDVPIFYKTQDLYEYFLLGVIGGLLTEVLLSATYCFAL